MAFFLVLCMLIGFFLSRAVLSIAMILFGINALRGVSVRRWSYNRWWLLGVAWIGCYALSWFWSGDPAYWHERIQIKLPILLLPLAFVFVSGFSKKQLWLYTLTICLLLLAGVGYSLYFLAAFPEQYIEAYGRATMLPVLPKNDYIRFSMLMAVNTAWCLYIFPSLEKKAMKWFTGISIVVFSIWLHVLAARTGLVAWYVLMIGCLLLMVCRKKTRKPGLLLFVIFLAAGIAASHFIPTLKARIGHFKYSIEVFRQGEMSGHYNDIGRYMSYDIAFRLIKEKPWTGVGAGDIMSGMKAGYDRWYPHVPEAQRLIPHNQFLVVAMAGGIPALLIFIIWVCYPLAWVRRSRSGFFMLVIWAMLLIPLLVEPMLETQFGVYVFLFPLLWQMRTMHSQKQASTSG